MTFLTTEELLYIAQRLLGQVQVRDVGLLEAAAARADASVFGADAYPTIHHKVAALMQSIARNHALVDGNKRLTLAAAIAVYGLDGWVFTLTNDEAYDLVIDIATARLEQVDDIAAGLEAAVTRR
jgi:death-on-curing protein